VWEIIATADKIAIDAKPMHNTKTAHTVRCGNLASNRIRRERVVVFSATVREQECDPEVRLSNAFIRTGGPLS